MGCGRIAVMPAQGQSGRGAGGCHGL